MHVVQRCKCSDLTDGYQWRCPQSGCRKKLMIRDQSFFQRSRLRLQTWVKLMYLWAVDAPVMKLQEQLDEGECSTKSAIDVFNFLREVCTNKLIAMGNIRLGSPNVIVQIDESLFNHKPKYHRGRHPHHEQWVFGLVARVHALDTWSLLDAVMQQLFSRLSGITHNQGRLSIVISGEHVPKSRVALICSTQQ